jgi:hypothetical protein
MYMMIYDGDIIILSHYHYNDYKDLLYHHGINMVCIVIDIPWHLHYAVGSPSPPGPSEKGTESTPAFSKSYSAAQEMWFEHGEIQSEKKHQKRTDWWVVLMNFNEF